MVQTTGTTSLDVETLAPVHGEPVPWSDFLAALEQLER